MASTSRLLRASRSHLLCGTARGAVGMYSAHPGIPMRCEACHTAALPPRVRFPTAGGRSNPGILHWVIQVRLVHDDKTVITWACVMYVCVCMSGARGVMALEHPRPYTHLNRQCKTRGKPWLTCSLWLSVVPLQYSYQEDTSQSTVSMVNHLSPFMRDLSCIGDLCGTWQGSAWWVVDDCSWVGLTKIRIFEVGSGNLWRFHFIFSPVQSHISQ